MVQPIVRNMFIFIFASSCFTVLNAILRNYPKPQLNQYCIINKVKGCDCMASVRYFIFHWPIGHCSHYIFLCHRNAMNQLQMLYYTHTYLKHTHIHRLPSGSKAKTFKNWIIPSRELIARNLEHLDLQRLQCCIISEKSDLLLRLPLFRNLSTCQPSQIIFIV